jgi:hypothetical protein
MRERARVAKVTVLGMAMRGAGKEEGKGGKAMAMATRMVGKRMATATKRAMAMSTRVAGKQQQQDNEGNSDSNESGG